MKKKCLLIFFLFIRLISVSLSQTVNLNGSTNLNTYYAYFSGDSSLEYLSSDIQRGLYFQQNSRFFLSYLLPYLSLNFNYISQPENITLIAKGENFSLNIGNNLNTSLSPLSLFNKNLNGILGTYAYKDFKGQFIFTSIEGRKKIKKFYGNDTQGPFIIGDFFLIPYKERVFLNGKTLERDMDYIIDYTYGILYFNFVISSQDEIIIEYEVSGAQEVYNLYGLSLSYKALGVSYLTLQNFANPTEREFLEFSFNINKDSNNYAEGRYAFSFLDNDFSGSAGYMRLSFKSSFGKGSFEFLSSEKDYPYISEILGNFNLTPGAKRLSLNLDLTPFSFLNYSLDLLNEENSSSKEVQNHKLSLSLFSTNLALNFKKENSKITEGVSFSYTPAFLNASFQTVNTESSTINIKSYNFSPQNKSLKASIYNNEKQTSSQNLLLEEEQRGANINILGDKYEFLLGEDYYEKKNLNYNTASEITQNFITDGWTFSFKLEYTPIEVYLYINGVYVENNGTFTLYLPDSTYETYTVEYFIEENSVGVFFENEEGKNPPPSGLTITFVYKAIIPALSYTKTDTLGIKLKLPQVITNISWQRIDKDANPINAFSISSYGMIFSNFWLNISGSTQLEEKKNTLSINSTYYFNPSSFYFGYFLNEEENIRTLSSKGNLILKQKAWDLSLSLDYYENNYYSIFLKSLSASSEGKLRLSSYELSGKITRIWKEASYSMSYYKNGAQDISILRDILNGKGEFSLTHENYSNNAERYILSLTFYQTKISQNSKIFVKYIYSFLNESILSIYQIGGNLSLNW